jgi:phosphohistidine phosphatase SixA
MLQIVLSAIALFCLAAASPAGSQDPAATIRVGQDRVAPGSSAVAKALADAAALAQASDPGGPGVVFLVRHAERADAGMAAAKIAGADPELSEAGKARATALAALLKDAKITAIFTTEYKRTRDTAQPLAAAAGIAATAVDSKDAAGLIARVQASAGNVLVVGHSNTVPDVIKALGVSEPVAIADDQFDNLFVVIRGARPALLRLHYR